MPSTALLTNKSFYHLFVLAFLLGAQLYQSFFANITAVKALARPQFRILQASIWPMYFKLQTALCVLLALTNTPKVHGSVMEDNILPGWLPSLQSESTKQGDRQTEMLKLTGMVTLAATNMLVLVPTTHKYVGKVHMIATREEKAGGASESPELKALRRGFLVFHGASYVCNMAVLVTSVWYAACVADKNL